MNQPEVKGDRGTRIGVWACRRIGVSAKGVVRIKKVSKSMRLARHAHTPIRRSVFPEELEILIFEKWLPLSQTD
jgi:hypothetical protein